MSVELGQNLVTRIVTVGTASAPFTSMLSGEADFSQAEPMYGIVSLFNCQAHLIETVEPGATLERKT
jgi:hypothetical protein